LKRCFGVDARIADCSWEYLSTMRTLKEPHEAMPRLQDFLSWLAQPRSDEIWVVLDIKVSFKIDMCKTCTNATTSLMMTPTI
jgi:hypothetical protein